ncbi:hypothetical protein FPV67DRAFT_1531596 [Lyophyllum atratum]|nr:hypothetical protein FPV67DRAFT_1531596 [Lyophyllum atratum]
MVFTALLLASSIELLIGRRTKCKLRTIIKAKFLFRKLVRALELTTKSGLHGSTATFARKLHVTCTALHARCTALHASARQCTSMHVNARQRRRVHAEDVDALECTLMMMKSCL